MAVAAAAVVSATFTPVDASARRRVKVISPAGYVLLERGLGPRDFCGGRLPGYGSDACGYGEVSYGPGSCWRRLPYRPYRPEPRRVWICG
jgi:hypothetical protein